MCVCVSVSVKGTTATSKCMGLVYRRSYSYLIKLTGFRCQIHARTIPQSTLKLINAWLGAASTPNSCTKVMHQTQLFSVFPMNRAIWPHYYLIHHIQNDDKFWFRTGNTENPDIICSKYTKGTQQFLPFWIGQGLRKATIIRSLIPSNVKSSHVSKIQVTIAIFLPLLTA